MGRAAIKRERDEVAAAAALVFDLTVFDLRVMPVAYSPGPQSELYR